mmetsp:Transcript_28778/g.73649  ORF Transcript_28778/g.73649 Transcript_28778/m.73649 type:complete len:81 (+) Transcript_28778:91-333(+)
MKQNDSRREGRRGGDAQANKQRGETRGKQKVEISKKTGNADNSFIFEQVSYYIANVGYTAITFVCECASVRVCVSARVRV